MNQDYIKADNWSIIEEGFDVERVKSSESLFSIGNGAMGQRANFEEHYSGETFQGSYIAGIYYPDKTKVGWWKNGYPEYFAKVLNAPNWIGIDIEINGENLDLHACTSVTNYRRELNALVQQHELDIRTVVSSKDVLAENKQGNSVQPKNTSSQPVVLTPQEAIAQVDPGYQSRKDAVNVAPFACKT